MQKLTNLAKKPTQRGVEIPRRPTGQVALLILGKLLIWAGVLVLGFAGYQLWGTNIAEASSQRSLKKGFQQFLAANPLPEPPSTTTTSLVPPSTSPGETTTVPVTTVAPAVKAPIVLPGEAVAIIRIPKLELEKIVVSGVGVPDLKKGPGHYISTPMPGEAGNAAIAGHRTTYGAPFYNLDSLEVGDEIDVTTRAGEFKYTVSGYSVVRPDDTSVLAATDDNRLTLTTCNPRFSDKQRLIITAALQGSPVAPGATVEAPAPVSQTDLGGGAEENANVVSSTVPVNATDSTATTLPAETSSELVENPITKEQETEQNSLAFSGDPKAQLPTFAWGLVALGVWTGFWALGRRWRKIPAFLLGVLPFSFVMFEFYQQFARVMPGHV